MGCFIGFSPYVLKGTIPKILSITIYTPDKITHIAPRDSIFIKHQNNGRVIALEAHIHEAAFIG
jgi:hypothetical protein